VKARGVCDCADRVMAHPAATDAQAIANAASGEVAVPAVAVRQVTPGMAPTQLTSPG
jgi:hypothetical protein